MLRSRSASSWPSSGQWRMPLPRHDVLDGEAPARNTFLAKAGFSVFPAAPVILNGLKHHSEPSAPKPAVGKQIRKLLADFPIVRPVSAAARLTGEIALDHIAGIGAV